MSACCPLPADLAWIERVEPIVRPQVEAMTRIRALERLLRAAIEQERDEVRAEKLPLWAKEGAELLGIAAAVRP